MKKFFFGAEVETDWKIGNPIRIVSGASGPGTWFQEADGDGGWVLAESGGRDQQPQSTHR